MLLTLYTCSVCELTMSVLYVIDGPLKGGGLDNNGLTVSEMEGHRPLC